MLKILSSFEMMQRIRPIVKQPFRINVPLSCYRYHSCGSQELPAKKPNVQAFAKEWIEAWNSHDLDRILSHYSEDFEIWTPYIKIHMGPNSPDSLKGKEAVRAYWTKGLQASPPIKFDLLDAAESINSIGLYYKSSRGKRVMEVMHFNSSGKVHKAVVHYTS